jgi:secondary thiamine-phosphate synthase enzyme
MFDILVGSRIRKGVMTVFVTGSTAGITTIEFEPNLVSDFKEMWQKLVPEGVPYHHDNTWGDANGYAHVRASRIGASLAVPFNNGELTLDTWQQVVLVDFDDKPRTRNIVALIMGE